MNEKIVTFKEFEMLIPPLRVIRFFDSEHGAQALFETLEDFFRLLNKIARKTTPIIYLLEGDINSTYYAYHEGMLNVFTFKTEDRNKELKAESERDSKE